MRQDHFVNPVADQTEQFDCAFEDGVLAQQSGASYEECPFGLPSRLNWTQDDIVNGDNPRMAGWLLGWWSADYLMENGEGRSAVFGAGCMAAALWAAAQGWETRDD